MASARTLHVKCTTWDQVEAFYARKLRRGNLLSMKVPFKAETGAAVTLGLELPNQLVIAIDGTVARASQIDGDPRTWIEIELFGLTDDVLGRLKLLVAERDELPIASQQGVLAGVARVRPPTRDPITVAPTEELPADERALFAHLTAELRRLRQAPVHEVLSVAHDAKADEIRRGWMGLMRRFHPDLVARRRAPAISHLAEELTILSNRAYDRLRAALVAEGRGAAFGPALFAPHGWLIGFDDLSTGDPARLGSVKIATIAVAGGTAPAVDATLPTPTAPPSSTSQGGGDFEQRARTMLGEGDAQAAREVLAAALCIYPRSRPLRSLYYVASALGALDAGQLMLATSQLETALAHHEGCVEAAQILEQIRHNGGTDHATLRRFFQ